ncbi:DUF3168 domain-containing protein [Paludisphaera sp.]|uniref:tail completion protein gp17 n=1 Tax=Paludisphaera sp. TaxID=2017432 RepID=UPI00301B9AEE
MAVLGSLRPLGSLNPFGSLGRSVVPVHRPASLREAVQWLLSRDLAIRALVGDRVHPDGLPQPPVHPAVTTLFIGGFDGRDYGGRSHSTTRLRVSCWAETPEDLDALAGAVKALLTDFVGRVGDVFIGDAWLVNGVDVQGAPGAGSSAWPRQALLDFQIQSL